MRHSCIQWFDLLSMDEQQFKSVEGMLWDKNDMAESSLEIFFLLQM
jgi:hypothetical protein